MLHPTKQKTMVKAKPTTTTEADKADKADKAAKVTDKTAKVAKVAVKADKADKASKVAGKATKDTKKGGADDLSKVEGGGAPVKVTFAKLLAGIKKITNKKENTIDKDDLLNLLNDLNVEEALKNQKNKKRANNGEKKHITLYNKFTSWIIKEMKDDINQQSKMKKAATIWTEEYKGNPAKLAEFKKKAGIEE